MLIRLRFSKIYYELRYSTLASWFGKALQFNVEFDPTVQGCLACSSEIYPRMAYPWPKRLRRIPMEMEPFPALKLRFETVRGQLSKMLKRNISERPRSWQTKVAVWRTELKSITENKLNAIRPKVCATAHPHLKAPELKTFQKSLPNIPKNTP